MIEKVNYFWSKGSKADLCEKQIITICTDNLCYHCGRLIPANSQAVCLHTDRGERYLLHEACAAKSCSPHKTSDTATEA